MELVLRLSRAWLWLRQRTPTLPAVSDRADGRAILPWASPHRIVFCFGLYSSGSTWVFNLVIRLLESRYPSKTVVRFYADRVEDFPKDAETAELIVIKSHAPHPALLALARYTASPVFLTLRDPRDAAKSLIDRFSSSFDSAIDKAVMPSSIALLPAQYLPLAQVFRFEQRFFDNAETAHAIAGFMELGPACQAADAFAALSRDKVAREIDHLAQTGAFGPELGVNHFDPKTHWHYRHIGDAKVGGYKEAFTPPQLLRIALACRDYGSAFGYDLSPLLEPKGVLDFGPAGQGRAYLKEGFTVVGERIWTEGPRAVVRLVFSDAPNSRVNLHIDFAPLTAAEPPKSLRCRLVVGGQQRSELEFPAGPMTQRSHDLTIPARDIPRSEAAAVVIEFLFDDLRSPKEMGLNPGDRKFGLLLFRLTYDCE